MKEFESVCNNSLETTNDQKPRRVKKVSFRRSLRPMRSMAKSKSFRPTRTQLPIDLLTTENLNPATDRAVDTTA